MTRTAAREIAVHFCFELGFTGQSAQELLGSGPSPARALPSSGRRSPVRRVPQPAAAGSISPPWSRGCTATAPSWTSIFPATPSAGAFPGSTGVAVAIMRVAMYEILYMQDIPNAAAINEGGGADQHYEEPEVASFVNGILAPLSGRRTSPTGRPPPPASRRSEMRAWVSTPATTPPPPRSLTVWGGPPGGGAAPGGGGQAGPAPVRRPLPACEGPARPV